MDFKSAYRYADFQFSSRYSGTERIEIAFENKKHATQFIAAALAHDNNSPGRTYNDIIVRMILPYDNQLKHPDLNALYGYWVWAKESARVI
ncbi:MAG: hypothetical protein LBR80_06150 [Deltaproteobacteria bacterium]|jgi:hypothetical protein|nr:hypothetical protein [Deltaproteobacteria bacterium]